MTRARPRRRHGRRQPLSEAQYSWLLWGHDGGAKPTLADHLVRRAPDRMRRLWREHRDELLPDFISTHPGRRPHAWWLFDAVEPSRRRLGGIGTPKHEV